MLAVGDLDQTLSEHDTMLTSGRDGYFGASLSAYRAIANALACADVEPQNVRTILDFGCGYGRVMRALRAAHPIAEITACDLMPGAIEFCADQFGATPYLGHQNIERMPHEWRFDLIWVGSVFTHLPDLAFQSMLAYLANILADDGVLVFTTHGRTAIWVFEKHTLGKSHVKPEQFEQLKRDFDERGFAFLEYTPGLIKHVQDKQGADIEHGTYGLSLTRIDWLCSAVQQIPDVMLVNFTEGGWGHNHDVTALQKPALLRAV